MIQRKSKFDLEPNPFERSFATKESSSLSLNELNNSTATTNNNKDANSDINSIGSARAISSTTKNSNKHNLHIPNISNVNQHSEDGVSAKLPGITPPLFTPGGRRLPPIGLSPGGSTAKYTSGLSNGSLSNNPDSSLWPNFIGNQNPQAPQLQLQQNFNQLLSSIRKTGLTPNESNIRLGLTPGGLGGFGFGNHLATGLSTPGAFLNGPITPGLSSLLGIPPSTSQPMNMASSTSMPIQQQQPQQHHHTIPHPQQPQQQSQPILGPPQTQVPIQIIQPLGQEITHIQNSTASNNQNGPTIVAVPPQIAQQLPQPQGVITTIPENSVGIFPIANEQEPIVSTNITPQDNTSTSQPEPAPEATPDQAPVPTPAQAPVPTPAQAPAPTPPTTTTTRKRKNSTKLADDSTNVSGTKKAKTSKAKKAEAKAKVKSEVTTEVVTEPQPEESEVNDNDGDVKDKEDSKPGKGKGKKRSNDEEKRKNFLERNRVAASKCRQRKKQLIQKMEDELAYYLTGYRELSAQVTQLRSQLMTLKNVISGHKDCGMFIQYIGGFNALNEIMQQADFATKVTEGAHSNMTSMPSTIPTTLNNVQPGATMQAITTTGSGGVTSEGTNSDEPPSAPTNTMAPPLPISINGENTSTHSNTRNVTPDILFDQQQAGRLVGGTGVNIVSHHSLTDLPAAAMGVNNGAFDRVVSEDGTNNGRDLRAISSMSNLAAMNTNNGNATTFAPF